MDHLKKKKQDINEDSEESLIIDLLKVKNDERTTLMIKNIPNKYTKDLILSLINKYHSNAYDFFYLPIDFKVN